MKTQRRVQWQRNIVSIIIALGMEERFGWTWMENHWGGEDRRKL